MNPFNPYVIGGVLIALLAAFVGGGILGWHEKSIRVPALLEAQKKTDQTACEAAQQLTKGANDAIQKADAYIASRRNSLSVQHPATCVRVPSHANIPASGAEHAGFDGNGLNTDWLRSYAATAETYRSELLICTDFLEQERKAQVQN